ncbi:MAG: cytochrome c maturation protein CcmE [Pseudomonadota bacterium]
MKRKHRRLLGVVAGLSVLGVATALILSGISSDLTFFRYPHQLASEAQGTAQVYRVGGFVLEGSHSKEADGVTHRFHVYDNSHKVLVRYRGLVPTLFAEGQGVIVEGKLHQAGFLEAKKVLAKHDENYVPKEIADLGGRPESGLKVEAAALIDALSATGPQARGQGDETS